MMPSRLSRTFALLAALLLAAAVTPVRAADNARTPISRDWILGVLETSGINITPDQMEQLSTVTAVGPKPRLKVVSVEVLDGESDKVRLQCQQPNTCLPFFVLLHWGQPGRQNGRTTQPAQQPENILVRSGKAAVLVFEGDFLRMTLPVMCLQNGGLGQQVRVLDKETKKTYLARVTALGVVTSVLPD
jgi:Chaperone for flagella basal body P-ring formation